MDEYDPSIPPRAPSVEAGLLWRKLCAKADAASHLAATAGLKPSVLVTNYGNRSFKKAWSTMGYEAKDAENAAAVLQKGVFVSESGKLALYNASLQTSPQPEYRKKMYFVNHLFNYSDLMDTAPSNSAIVVSPDLFPHANFDIFKLAINNDTGALLTGLVAVEYGLDVFLQTLGAKPIN